jgi:hypothetical protein
VLINYADTITIQTDTLTALTYNPSGQNINPTNTITGLVAGDVVFSLNYNYTGGPGNSYSSSSPPSDVGTYSITPSNLSLVSGGALSNYYGVVYKKGSVTINKANQNPIYILSTLGIFQSNPSTLPLYVSGGNDTGTVSYLLISGGTASNCLIEAGVLKVNSTGTCKLLAIKAATNNYFVAYSDTATVTFSIFYSHLPVQTQSTPTQIPINGQHFLDTSQSNAVPNITSIQLVGSTYEINGTGFAGTNRVVIGGSDASITSVTSTKVVISSAGLMPGPLFIECSDGRMGPSPFYFFVP